MPFRHHSVRGAVKHVKLIPTQTRGITAPKRVIRKGGSDQEICQKHLLSHVELITFKVTKQLYFTDFLVGYPFSDPPLGDGEGMGSLIRIREETASSASLRVSVCEVRSSHKTQDLDLIGLDSGRLLILMVGISMATRGSPRDLDSAVLSLRIVSSRIHRVRSSPAGPGQAPMNLSKTFVFYSIQGSLGYGA